MIESVFRRYGPVAGLLVVLFLLLIAYLLAGAGEAGGLPPLDAPRVLILFAVGVFAGVLGGLLGVGGATIMLPIMYFYLGFPETIAIGTGLFVVIFTSLSGAYGHVSRRNADLAVAKWLALGGIAGVIAGSWLFTLLAGETGLLGLILGIVFLVPAIQMIREGLFQREPARGYAVGADRPAWAVPGFGLVVGVLTGVTGLGGGYALVPGLIYIFGVPVYVTMGTSLAALIPMAVIGGGIKVVQGFVAVGAGLILALGSVLGAQIGAATIRRFSPEILKLIFGLYFAYAAIRFIAEYFGVALP
ncbi:sulfite exporter TauE/SafE family protein [Methanoculleus sp. FWC-SCC1]|uniref:Probable membrane transporter protein n=1 Tax=Methanoculleus frigidifontis TaxID=2584085 RepID=A0ABT8MAB1_9EURY|nr:sulfite exporter TauE/SafE family protein [Methanoculleus sp. FWC-SCC1]